MWVVNVKKVKVKGTGGIPGKGPETVEGVASKRGMVVRIQPMGLGEKPVRG